MEYRKGMILKINGELHKIEYDCSLAMLKIRYFLKTGEQIYTIAPLNIDNTSGEIMDLFKIKR